MSDDTRRKIDAKAGDEIGLWIHMHGPDPEVAEWAAEKLIEHYAGLGKHGALLKLREMGMLPIELREKAELAIVASVPLHEDPVPGRQPKKYGILNDLAFDRQRPESVRIAAGKKHVDRLIERIRRGDASAKTEIDALAKHRRYHREVKDYSRHALDAFEAAKEKQKAKDAFRGKRVHKQPTASPQQGMPKGRLFVS